MLCRTILFELHVAIASQLVFSNRISHLHDLLAPTVKVDGRGFLERQVDLPSLHHHIELEQQHLGLGGDGKHQRILRVAVEHILIDFKHRVNRLEDGKDVRLVGQAVG